MNEEYRRKKMIDEKDKRVLRHLVSMFRKRRHLGLDDYTLLEVWYALTERPPSMMKTIFRHLSPEAIQRFNQADHSYIIDKGGNLAKK